MTFRRRHVIALASAIAVSAATVTVFTTRATSHPRGGEQGRPTLGGRTLDGSGNNQNHPAWGEAGTQYARVAAANYADGVGAIVQGPSARSISDRIFNDVGQNLFSENATSQWAWAWGQFLDHDMDLRDETPGESAPLAFNAKDPLETFRNDFGALDFSRTPAAPGTGGSRQDPRQQINTISSFIDASNVYGTTPTRLDWLRAGSVDGDPTNNSASLMLTKNGYLPRRDARGNAQAAPPMDLQGPLMGTPAVARVAGDVRANENIGLTSIQTMFAREHNRIVAALPNSLSAEEKFQIARRVVGAEVQFITYTEFLPALGVNLPAYRGYNSRVNPAISNEFATVGYRAHSQVHGEFDVDFDPGDFTDAQLAAFAAQGIKVTNEDAEHTLTVPLDVAFGNPGLLEQLGEDKVLASLSAERQYRNDEQIDNTMRSVLFEVPKPGVTDPAACSTPKVDPNCFTGVQDLGALDVARGRDHGMPTYNQLRAAYGLPPVRSFTQITGERTSAFPKDPMLNQADPNNDPNSLDFVDVRDRNGEQLVPGSDESMENAVTGVRRTTVAARLRALYGSVDKVDAFVGMVAERHRSASDLGPLQAAIWSRQFQALRDGDRYFFANDRGLAQIQAQFGITFRHSLAELVATDSGAKVQPDVFKVVFTAN